MNNLKGSIALLCTSMIYGTFGVFVRYISSDLTAFQMNLVVNVFVVLLVGLNVLRTGKKLSFTKSARKYVVLYGVFFGIAGTLFTLSALSTKLATMVFAIYTSSLTLSLLLSVLVFKERITVKKTISFLLAVAGLLSFTYPLSITTVDIGLVYGLIVGVMAVLANTIGKQAAGKVGDESMILARMTGPSICALVLILLNNQPVLSHVSFFTVAMIGLFGIGLFAASYLHLFGFRHTDLNFGTVILSAELLFAGLYAAVLFAETPSRNELIGGLCIIAAIVIANSSFAASKTPEST